ncbi:hypothetical protein ACEWPL_004325 [Roseovarius sp. S1116L3]|uniref:hypothetical protein n=1 Tax=Roseovarius roseus TaxID=3342636 RepID=UPI003727DD7C
MPSYTIVDVNVATLGPGEIRAGGRFQVSDGEIYVLAPSVADTVDFPSASDTSVEFELRINSAKFNGFDIKFDAGLPPTLTIANDADLSDVKINAKSTDGLILDARDGFRIGSFTGSSMGPNTITMGDEFSTDGAFKLGGAENILIVGDRATFMNLNVGKGACIGAGARGTGLPARPLRVPHSIASASPHPLPSGYSASPRFSCPPRS